MKPTGTATLEAWPCTSEIRWEELQSSHSLQLQVSPSVVSFSNFCIGAELEVPVQQSEMTSPCTDP